MRIAAVLFGLVLATAVVLGAVIGSGVAMPAQLAPHPDHPTLLQATDGATRIAPVAALGALFGALQIGFFGACFLLGMRRGGPLPGVLRPTLVGLAVYEVVFAALLLAYRSFARDPSGALVLGFPLPTALMLYLLWPVPVLFLWIYLRHFDRWVPDEAEIERLRSLGVGSGAGRAGPP